MAAVDEELWRRELSPEFVGLLLNQEGAVPRERRLPPSRLLLLQAYDATHNRPQGKYQPCALQQIKKGLMMNRPVRLAATVDLFRKLTGDLLTPSEALGSEAEAIARKRDGAGHTPSASMRRWLGETPLCCVAQAQHGSFGASRLPAHASPGGGGCGADTWYHTSSNDLSRKSERLSRSPAQSVAFASRTGRPRAQTPPPFGSVRAARSGSSPSPASYNSSANTMARSTRNTGRQSAAFASRTPTGRERPNYREKDYLDVDAPPGPGHYHR